MTDLNILLDEDHRPAVVHDIATTMDDYVTNAPGLKGKLLRGAVSTATKVDDRIISKAVNKLLPETLTVIQPVWDEYEAKGESDFGSYLADNSDDVISGVLGVVDRNVEKTDNGALTKIYKSLRGKAEDFIEPTLPELGRAIQKNMGV